MKLRKTGPGVSIMCALFTKGVACMGSRSAFPDIISSFAR